MEMNGLKHMSHRHSLTLTKYDGTPENSVCHGCHETISVGISVYRCSRIQGTSTASQTFGCEIFFLHTKCSELPPYIHHPRHETHHLSLYDFSNNRSMVDCYVCHSKCRENFLYRCKPCQVYVCLQCGMQERRLNHEFHNHPLTLLPLKSAFPCGACGVKGIEEFSYLCQTCLFWIHKSCALAPKTLICKLHHRDHPLLLSDSSILESYHREGLFCSICQLEFDEHYWIYYCCDCRFFSHVECAIKPLDENATEDDDEEDDNHSKHVKFPVRNDEHHMYYRLIQDFAKTCSSTSTDNHISTSEDGIISHCGHGHPLGLINEHMMKDIHKLNELLCDGCFQPLSATSDSFYGCVNCKIFLHKVCFTELPVIIEHPSHPEHKLIRRLQIGETIYCNLCFNRWDGIFYECERSSCSFTIDIMCTLLPRKIKHESHKHYLTQQLDSSEETCYGCSNELEFGHFKCNKCRFRLHAGCAISPGTIKHRWDEHRLHLVYPPVKHHPHEFNCEFCSEDINPNFWFYFCRECDICFHVRCVRRGNLLAKSNLYNLRFPEICTIL